ncbi:hypothetical protein V2A60_001466 [Cordyceps javanica]|uniref:Uncharacterized protein n=1 Tax=Cordyceps javanica TaxID=43265 RepID=A0A545WC67_9HYPO|nr:hypothetical protein IF1G_00313 [Cordyceps javanica]TQW11570.1 hypothetical protein IF2G_00301 [Cordyceps javanica]
MRSRFFKQDARYIALKELNGEGKYLRARTSLDSAGDESDTYTPSFKKRMSDAFSRKSPSRRLSLTLTSSSQWKRASLSRAVTATRGALAGMPLYRRDSHRRGRDDTDDEEDGEADEELAVEAVGKKRASWIQSWITTPAPEFGTTFTIAHSTLFVAVSV